MILLVRERGVVLLMSLLLLGLLSAVMILQLEMLLLYQKSSQQWTLRQNHRRDLEQVAQQFRRRVEQNLPISCLVAGSAHPNDVLISLKMTGSKSTICQVNQGGSVYRVILEDLGCRQSWVQAAIQQSVDTKPRFILQDRRVTVMSGQAPYDYLQVRFLIKNLSSQSTERIEMRQFSGICAASPACMKDRQSPLIQVQSGIQSWRLGSAK